MSGFKERSSSRGGFHPSPTSGHVFVVHGDLSILACDAWMLPTDDKMNVEPTWHVQGRIRIPSPLPDDWSNTGRRVYRLTEYAKSLSPPWLVNVGGIKLPKCDWCHLRGATKYCPADAVNLCQRCNEDVHSANPIAAKHDVKSVDDIKWYIEGAKLFLAEVAQHLNGVQPSNERVKQLIALPLVGTGKGGAYFSAGAVVAQLLPVLYQAVETYQFDIALVTIQRSTFAAIQLERNRFAEESKVWEAVLTSSQRNEARRLATLAREGKLVLFIGAGVSCGAGLPTWKELLDHLAQLAGINEKEVELLDTMSYLDSARVIEIRLGGADKLLKAIADHVQVFSYSLACGLLVGLPVQEWVTTNYNQMVELACKGIGIDVAVLPYSPSESSDRWLLKMHGCVTHPEDIVLTREHYIRYESQKAALSGIVQSLLITRHMAFIGFSLRDDNFHRIADEVRRSLGKVSHPPQILQSKAILLLPHEIPGTGTKSPSEQAAPVVNALPSELSPSGEQHSHGSDSSSTMLYNEATRKFGTQIYLNADPVADLLWEADLNLLPMEQRGVPVGQARRHLEIFLDYLLSQATTTTAFLLNPQYDTLLSVDQRALRNVLQEFVQSLSENDAAKRAPEYQYVVRALSKLGLVEHEGYKAPEIT